MKKKHKVSYALSTKCKHGLSKWMDDKGNIHFTCTACSNPQAQIKHTKTRVDFPVFLSIFEKKIGQVSKNYNTFLSAYQKHYDKPFIAPHDKPLKPDQDAVTDGILNLILTGQDTPTAHG